MVVQRGMTLVEVLVALTLMGLLSVGIFAVFKTGQRTYQQVMRIDTAAGEVIATQRLLRRIIESTYPFASDLVQPRFGLEGSDQELALTAAAPGFSAMGHYRYHLYTRPGRGGLKDLIVEYGIDRNGVMLTEQRNATESAREEVLLKGIQSLELKYLSVTEATNAETSGMPPDWTGQWRQQSKLPTLVQVEVRFPVTDLRQWPALVAAPYVTANARCEFDVVAQSCRGGQ